MLWSGFVNLDVAEDADRVTVTYRPGYSDPGPLRLEVWVTVGNPRPAGTSWQSEPMILGAADRQETHTVEVDLPPLPAEDYSVGVAIFCDGQRTMTGAIAHRLHRGTRISALNVYALDDVALRYDLETGVMNKAEWLEALRDLQRRRQTPRP